MECLNCQTELKLTPGKRKKQFCNPNCRVTYWQKNKPKKETNPEVAELLEKIIGLEERIRYLAEGKIEVKQELGRIMKDNIELLAKNAALETQINPSFKIGDFNKLAHQRDNLAQLPVKSIEDALSKPKTTLKDKKATDVPKKEDRGEEGAKNGAGNYSITHHEYDSEELNKKCKEAVQEYEAAKNGADNYMAPRDQVTYDIPPLKRIQDEPDWQKGVNAGPDKRVIKKTYNQWLNLAKEIELEDEKEEFERELAADTSINARQKDMIRSKIKH